MRPLLATHSRFIGVVASRCSKVFPFSILSPPSRAFLLHVSPGQLSFLRLTVLRRFTASPFHKPQLGDRPMKPVSIDAVRQRKIELEKQYDALVLTNSAILDKQAAEKRPDLTAAETSDFNTNTESVIKLKASIAREQFILTEVASQLEREKNLDAVAVNDSHGAVKSRKLWVKGFAQQLQAVHKASNGGSVDPRLLGTFGDFDERGVFQAAGGSDGAMNEAVPSEGGFLVGADISEKIYQRTYLTGEITRRCQRQPITATSNRLKLRVVDEDSRADGSRMGGVLAFWANEADTFMSSRPKFREIELFLNKLTALVYATDELLADGPALEAWIMNNMPTELAFRIEDALFSGTGAGQPAGILNSQAFLSLSPGNTATIVTGTDVEAMWARFWHPGLKNSIASIATENLTAGQAVGNVPAAAWFIDQTVIPQLFSMQVGSGSGPAVILLYHPPGGNPLYGPYGELLGLPVIPTEHNAVLGTVGDIVLADMSQVLLADKGAVQVAQSMHVRFVQGEQAFRFTCRVDAQTTWKKPLTPKNGGSTMSPFVGLASGANR
jgi:HK97 family phage major capsid protein